MNNKNIEVLMVSALGLNALSFVLITLYCIELLFERYQGLPL